MAYLACRSAPFWIFVAWQMIGKDDIARRYIKSHGEMSKKSGKVTLVVWQWWQSEKTKALKIIPNTSRRPFLPLQSYLRPRLPDAQKC